MHIPTDQAFAYIFLPQKGIKEDLEPRLLSQVLKAISKVRRRTLKNQLKLDPKPKVWR